MARAASPSPASSPSGCSRSPSPSPSPVRRARSRSAQPRGPSRRHRRSASPSLGSGGGAGGSNDRAKDVVKTSLMFIGAVGAASLVAHKYWPRGYPYGEKEEWEERLEKLEKPSKKKKTTPPLRSRDDDAEQHYYDKRGRDRHRSMQDFRRRDEHEHDGLLLQHQHNVRGGSGRLLVRRLDRSDTEMATVGSRSPQPIGRRRSLAVDGGSGGRQRLEEQRGSSHPPHVPTHAGSAAAAAAADDGDDDDSACRVRRVRFIEERHGPAAMPTRLQQPATVRHHVVESSHYKKIAG